MIRVGEDGGSNPPAPIYLSEFAGILVGVDRLRIGVMERRYGIGDVMGPSIFHRRNPCKREGRCPWVARRGKVG
jgi:hypothetical protein